jgi:hypothetical protein
MNDLSLVLRETSENQINKTSLNTIQKNEKINSKKEIFFILNDINNKLENDKIDKIVIKKIVNKENSMSQKKAKIINNNKKEKDKILDFDKILFILNNQEPKKKKILSNKRKRKNITSNTGSKIKSFYIFLENHFKKKGKQNLRSRNIFNRNINDIYNISYFYSNSNKIEEKSLPVNVKIPEFKELEDNFFIDDNCTNEVN